MPAMPPKTQRLGSILRALSIRLAISLAVGFLLHSPARAGLEIAVSETPLSLPFFVAESQGLFKKHKLQVNLKPCFAGVTCLNMVHKSEADLATCSELPVVFSAFDRDDYALITSFVTNKNDLRMIVNTGGASGPTEFNTKNLIGKKIGVTMRSASQYYSDLFLLYNVIDPAQVEQVNLPPEEMGQALIDGRVDAISAWEPFGYRVLKRGSKQYQVLKAPKLYTHTFNLVGSKQALKLKQQEINTLMLVLQESISIIKDQPQLSKNLLTKRLSMDPAFVEEMFPTYNFGLNLRQSLLSTMRGQIKWAEESGYSTGPIKQPNLLRVIDSQPLRTLDKRLDEISKP